MDREFSPILWLAERRKSAGSRVFGERANAERERMHVSIYLQECNIDVACN